MRRVLTGAPLPAALIVGCGSSREHHAAAPDSGLTRLVAVCRQAQQELLGIYERNIEHGTPSVREVERELRRGEPGLTANLRRRMGRAARESVAVLSAAGARMETLPLGKSGEVKARTAALRNLAEHRSLLVEFEHEIHRLTNPGEVGWISLYAERAQACGQQGGK